MKIIKFAILFLSLLLAGCVHYDWRHDTLYTSSEWEAIQNQKSNEANRQSEQQREAYEQARKQSELNYQARKQAIVDTTTYTFIGSSNNGTVKWFWDHKNTKYSLNKKTVIVSLLQVTLVTAGTNFNRTVFSIDCVNLTSTLTSLTEIGVEKTTSISQQTLNLQHPEPIMENTSMAVVARRACSSSKK